MIDVSRQQVTDGLNCIMLPANVTFFYSFACLCRENVPGIALPMDDKRGAQPDCHLHRDR
jgi:hypothetical protein